MQRAASRPARRLWGWACMGLGAGLGVRMGQAPGQTMGGAMRGGMRGGMAVPPSVSALRRRIQRPLSVGVSGLVWEWRHSLAHAAMRPSHFPPLCRASVREGLQSSRPPPFPYRRYPRSRRSPRRSAPRSDLAPLGMRRTSRPALCQRRRHQLAAWARRARRRLLSSVSRRPRARCPQRTCPRRSRRPRDARRRG